MKDDDIAKVWYALRLTDRKTDAHDEAKAALARIEASAEAMRQALEAADYYIDRLEKAFAGKPVRDLEEAAEHVNSTRRARAALQPGGAA